MIDPSEEKLKPDSPVAQASKDALETYARLQKQLEAQALLRPEMIPRDPQAERPHLNG